MKVFLSVDMEGISGLVRWPDVVRAGLDFERNRVFMTQDANAAIAGAFEGGASEVVVEENHGVEDLCDLRLDEIDPRCRVIRGAGRPTATTMAGLDAEVAVVLLIGHHARAGSFPGIMAHTVSYTEFKAVRVGGSDCGEGEIFAIRAGELGVPVGLISGDQIVIEQVRKRVPQAQGVEVKRALSTVAGDVIPPERARPMIREGARRAVERARAGELVAYLGELLPPTRSRWTCAALPATICAQTSSACPNSNAWASARSAPWRRTWTRASDASPTWASATGRASFATDSGFEARGR